MGQTPWYEDFFGEDYLRIYTPRLTAERTTREVDGVVRLLALPAGSLILDLCCGHGRHAIELASQGFRVTGQDLSALFLERAAGDAGKRGAAVEWVCAYMREIPFTGAFDAVVH